MSDKSRPTEAIPVEFLNRMSGFLGDEYGSFLNSLSLPAVVGLRINTLKASFETFLQAFPFNLLPVDWCSSGYMINPSGEANGDFTPGNHPYHAAGLYYLQEPSAMAAAEILAPQPGERVLDLAAAPGGKATHLAALMKNTGLLVVNEIHPKRVWDLAENLERCGVTNAIITNDSPEKLAAHFGEYFDRVLLDAPCSGEGMFRKGNAARHEWKPELVHSCALRQSAILEQAARLVKPGGLLAYTTCTFSAEENEGVIATFLTNHREFSMSEIAPIPSFQPARPEWINLPSDHTITQAVRIWPHLSQGEGHFIALLSKHATTQPDPAVPLRKKARKINAHGKSALTKDAMQILDHFCQSNLDFRIEVASLIQDGSYIYVRQENVPDLTGLRVIRPGWWLGTADKNRFTPSHSLAMGIQADQARNILPLRIGDPQLSAYMKGESIPNPGVEGWILVTIDGYPLGWGKRVQNVVKNFYPRGLRRYS